mgnify:CR=1 FL=1
MCNSITCVQVRTKREQNIHVFRNFSVSKYFNCFSTLSMYLEILKKPCKCVKYHKSVRLYIDIRTYLDRCSRKEIIRPSPLVNKSFTKFTLCYSEVGLLFSSSIFGIIWQKRLQLLLSLPLKCYLIMLWWIIGKDRKNDHLLMSAMRSFKKGSGSKYVFVLLEIKWNSCIWQILFIE